jgi:AmmeMemoRadiSam system protein A
MHLSAADAALLFRIARDSIAAHLQGTPQPAVPGGSPLLQERRGVFVTLHLRGRLRGCIGYLEAVKPLGQAVQEMALAAAFQDPRFPPLSAPELAEIHLEISVLSPMRRIDNIDDIEVGVHGLYVEFNGRRGLLLPQVATECRWDRFTFLQQTCIKACLPADAWQYPATRIFVFTADILSEPPAAAAPSCQESTPS